MSADRIIQVLDAIQTSLNELRSLLAAEHFKENGPAEAELDVSEIQFKTKSGDIAGPLDGWGWTFAYTRDNEYHPESRDLVQAVERYGEVRVGGRVYYLAGRDGNLLNFKKA